MRCSSRARLRASLIVMATTAVCFAFPGGNALAAKGGKTGSTGGGLSLVSEYIQNSPNPGAPTWCLNEDDYRQRNWSGSVAGTFSATEQLCGSGTDMWDAGGIGLQVDLYATGTVDDVAITSPNGDSHHGVLVDSTTYRRVTENHYQVCYVPPFSRQYDVGGTPLPGGTWLISLTGNISKVSYSLTAQMASVQFQQTYCPASEQNLV
jgi:hypothetical protein